MKQNYQFGDLIKYWGSYSLRFIPLNSTYLNKEEITTRLLNSYKIVKENYLYFYDLDTKSLINKVHAIAVSFNNNNLYYDDTFNISTVNIVTPELSKLMSNCVRKQYLLRLPFTINNYSTFLNYCPHEQDVNSLFIAFLTLIVDDSLFILGNIHADFNKKVIVDDMDYLQNFPEIQKILIDEAMLFKPLATLLKLI